MTLNQSTISEISWCSGVPPTSLSSSIVLTTRLGFATLKFLVADPKARTYCLLRISVANSGHSKLNS